MSQTPRLIIVPDVVDCWEIWRLGWSYHWYRLNTQVLNWQHLKVYHVPEEGKWFFLSVSVKRICRRWPAHSKGYGFFIRSVIQLARVCLPTCPKYLGLTCLPKKGEMKEFRFGVWNSGKIINFGVGFLGSGTESSFSTSALKGKLKIRNVLFTSQ